MTAKPLDSVITQFSSHIGDLANVQDKELKSSMKELYDFTKSQEKDELKVKTNGQILRNLIVDDFDLEQIWQQVELQNDAVIGGAVQDISGLLVKKNELIFDFLNDSAKPPLKSKKAGMKNTNIQIDRESSDYESDDSVKEQTIINAESSEEDSEVNSGGNLESKSPSPTGNKGSSNQTYKKSIVDDAFFKLNEMEAFLEKEENPKPKNTESGSESDDESIDLFEQESDDEDDEEDGAKTARFKDYFVQKEEELEPKRKRNRLMEELDQESSDESEPEDEEVLEKELKSSLELRQERLKRKIDDLEERAISEKPWQLKGEITAEGRPQNSLLEEVVEFDMTSRPAPIITTETSLQLEDVIRQRLKDKAFDSVERKLRPVETPLEYKKKLVLNQEKSKESLANIYEKEFLDQQAALDKDQMDTDEPDPETHKEVKRLMNSLFTKLDALSNFHFTSTPAIPELKIVRNLPAINMEEVAPVAYSDAALLAPEEIKSKPKGDIIGKDERSRTDKKRDRRRKKLKQKIHSKRKAKIEEKKADKKNRVKA